MKKLALGCAGLAIALSAVLFVEAWIANHEMAITALEGIVMAVILTGFVIDKAVKIKRVFFDNTREKFEFEARAFVVLLIALVTSAAILAAERYLP